MDSKIFYLLKGRKRLKEERTSRKKGLRHLRVRKFCTRDFLRK